MIVDRIDLGIVGPQQLSAELQIVGRVGEDQVDALLGQARQRLQAIALDDPIRFEGHDAQLRSHHGCRPARLEAA